MSYGVNAPWGFRPEKHLDGSIFNGQMDAFSLASGYATSIFTGDPVYLTGGTIVRATAGAGNPILGIFMGVKYKSAVQGINGNYIFSPYWPASTATLNSEAAEALVITDPSVVYNIQSYSSAGTPIGVAAADIGKNASITFANAGSTLTGQSGCCLDADTIAANAATGQLKIKALVPINVNSSPGNVFSVAYNNVEVVINNGWFHGTTAGAS